LLQRVGITFDLTLCGFMPGRLRSIQGFKHPLYNSITLILYVFGLAMTLHNGKYFSLRTQKRDGSYVDTPVWFVSASKGGAHHVFANINSGKVKRIRNFATVQIAVCDWRGGLLGPWQPARAELVPESVSIYVAFQAKYGLVYRVFELFSRLLGKHKERQMICVSLTPT
jgi:PPOX class probable F420-dependent enzyme